MSHESRPPEAPTSAAGDSIILHVPACVQRFSSRRRILSRLRALARRRSRGLPELETAPLKLQIEANPNWRAGLQDPGAEPASESQDWSDEEGSETESTDNREAYFSAPLSPADAASPPAARAVPQDLPDANAALIQQLEEDNQDLKAALCRLIRIAEENEGALRLLEQENEELSTLVHRLTIGQMKAVPPVPAAARARRRWEPGIIWLKRRLDRRCI